MKTFLRIDLVMNPIWSRHLNILRGKPVFLPNFLLFWPEDLFLRIFFFSFRRTRSTRQRPPLISFSCWARWPLIWAGSLQSRLIQMSKSCAVESKGAWLADRPASFAAMEPSFLGTFRLMHTLTCSFLVYSPLFFVSDFCSASYLPRTTVLPCAFV